MSVPLFNITKVGKSSRKEKIICLKVKDESSKHMQCKIIIFYYVAGYL